VDEPVDCFRISHGDRDLHATFEKFSCDEELSSHAGDGSVNTRSFRFVRHFIFHSMAGLAGVAEHSGWDFT
jgi:hypothetical protein